MLQCQCRSGGSRRHHSRRQGRGSLRGADNPAQGQLFLLSATAARLHLLWHSRRVLKFKLHYSELLRAALAKLCLVYGPDGALDVLDPHEALVQRQIVADGVLRGSVQLIRKGRRSEGLL